MKTTLSLLTLAIVGVLTFYSFNTEKKETKIATNEAIDAESQTIDTSRNDEGDTFSIVAYDPNTGQVGGAGCSCVNFNGGINFLSDLITDNNGNIIGGIHSQASYNEATQTFARNRMLTGDSPQQIINNTVASDAGSASRQYGVVGFNNSGNLASAGFTGSTNGHYGNHIGGSDSTGMTYAIQGNILDNDNGNDSVNGQDLLDDMETAFKNLDGTLAEKLMAAMQAAKRVGGDSRCEGSTNSGKTAFVQVLSPGESTPSIYYNTDAISGQPTTNGVPNFTEPIDKLQDMFDAGEGVTFCEETVTNFPYVMDFETTSWKRFNLDTNANDDDRSWMRDRGATGSGDTGPSAANQGTFYSYLETSNITGASESAAIASPCFVIPEDKAAAISFDYHMFGADIGTLSLQANNQSGAGWVTLWTQSGSKGNNWFNDVSVDLLAYSGDTVRLRFIGSRANSGFAGDMAIDDIKVTTEDYCNSTVTYNGGPFTPTNLRNTLSIESDLNTIGANIDACSLLVTNNATLTIAAGTYANIRGDVTVDAGSKIIIEHQGSLVQILENATVTNNGEIEVKLTTPALNARDFMIMGSPMDIEDNTAFNDAFQVLSHNTDNYTMFTSQAIDGINFYDEGTDELAPRTGVLNPGEGYIVRPSFTEDGTYNYTFDSGTLNSGEVIYTAGYNGTKDDSANLIANPYASAIDANLFLAENSGIVSEIYFWEHLTTPTETNGPYGAQNFSMNDISTYNNMGGTAAASNGGSIPNNIISTAQGFGIKANAGGDIKFTNAMRVTSGNTTLRTTSTTSSLTDANRLWLTISEAESNNSSSNLIGFTAAATAGLDYGYDTEKIGTLVSLYTHLQDGSQRLSIQSREAFDSDIEIPMGFSSIHEDESTYTISILNREGNLITDAKIYLIDNLTGITTNLNEHDYVFNSFGGTYDERFTVVFKERAVLNTETTELLEVSLSPNPASNFVDINAGTTFINAVTVYDINGRKVIATNTDSTATYKLNTQSLQAGMYLISIATDNRTITKRLMKK